MTYGKEFDIMDIFSPLFKELPGYESLREALTKKISPVSVTGISHIHRANLLTAMTDGGVNLLIAASEAEAKRLCDDANTMAGREIAAFFPSRELCLSPADSANHEYEYMRIAALSKAAKDQCSVVCASIEAVMQPTIPVGVLIASALTLKQGQTVDLHKLCTSLADM